MGKTRLQRFQEKTQPSPIGCVIWIGATDPNGYGRFRDGVRLTSPHRWIYLQKVGPIPEGFDIDHLCRNPSCVNPKHLQAVSRKVNLARSPHTGTENFCKRGHPRSAPNTYQHPNGSKVCRACERERNRRRNRKAPTASH